MSDTLSLMHGMPDLQLNDRAARTSTGLRRMTRLAALAALACAAPFALVPRAQAQMAPKYQSPLAQNPQPQVIQLPRPTPITPNGTVVEDVIVRVNDQIINRSDLERGLEQLRMDASQPGANPTAYEAARKDMLRDMIDKQLLLSRGKELGINPEAEVIRQLDDIRKRNNLDSMEDLEKAARQQGVSFEDFKADIASKLITQQVVRDEVGRRIQISLAQEQAFYDAHKAELTQPESLSLFEILVPTPANADAAALAKSKAQADEIETKFKAGEKFQELAKKYSGGPTASSGGVMGDYHKGDGKLPGLEDQTFALQSGQASAPIRTRQGYVILYVEKHMPAGVPPLKDVEPQITDGIYMEQMQPRLREYLTKLRDDAFIEIAPGFVDTGASPNKKSQIVNTAYAPPAPKKKKADKTRAGQGVKAPAAAVAGGAPAAATLVSAPVQLDKHGKPKKLKREKIRMGQAPRTALPAGPVTGMAEDHGLGLGSGNALAPGAAMTDDNPLTLAANVNPEDPLAPKEEPKAKTRYSARAADVAAAKQHDRVVKTKEKIDRAPTPMTEEEKAAAAIQSAPLGLAGDTSKKKKVKVKRKKGDPVNRLQEKAPPAPEVPNQPANTVNPKALGGVPAAAPDSPTNPTTGPTGPMTPGVPGTSPAPAQKPVSPTSLPPTGTAPGQGLPTQGTPVVPGAPPTQPNL